MIHLEKIYSEFCSNGNDDLFSVHGNERLRTAKTIFLSCGIEINNSFVVSVVWEEFEMFILSSYKLCDLDWYEAPIFHTWCEGAFSAWYKMNTKIALLE